MCVLIFFVGLHVATINLSISLDKFLIPLLLTFFSGNPDNHQGMEHCGCHSASFHNDLRCNNELSALCMKRGNSQMYIYYYQVMRFENQKNMSVQ